MRSGRMNNEPTDAEIERSRSRIAAVLGPEEIAKLDGESLPGIGHNVPPPEPVDVARERVAELIDNVGKWAKQCPVIDNEDLASACNDFLGQLDKQWQAYDAQRKAEKTPFDDAAAAVQAKWKPLLDRLTFCKSAIKPLHDAWLKLLDQRLTEERRARQREADEAQRRADQLAEQAKAPGPGTLPNMIAAKEASDEADRARQAAAAVPRRAQTRGTFGGRTRSLQATWHAQVIDWDLWYAHVRNRGEVRDLLSQLANAAVRSKEGPRPPVGMTEGISPLLPGCLIFSQET